MIKKPHTSPLFSGRSILKIFTIYIIFTFLAFAQIACPAFAKNAQDNGITLEHNEPGIYIFKLNTKKIGDKIKPYVADKLTTASSLYKKNDDFVLVVNGGFFDPSSGAAVSYVTINNKQVETPFSNMDLILNAGKSNRLEAILNRAEFRVLEDERGNLSFDINSHFAPPEEGKIIKHSLQGGPFVYPFMNLEKESFVITKNAKVQSQSADVLKRRERTVLALKNEILYLIIFSNHNKVTMGEVKDFCKKMKFDKAMALDGGASTSANYRDVEIYSAIGAQRRVKSFLVVEK